VNQGNVMNKPNPESDRLVVSLEYAAWRLSVSPSFLRLEIGRGKINPVRLGRRVLISEAEIDRYLAANTRSDNGRTEGDKGEK
jgi:excisionase family DNA binding protein